MQLKTTIQLHLFVAARTLQSWGREVISLCAILLRENNCSARTQDTGCSYKAPYLFRISAFPSHWNMSSSQLLLHQQEAPNPAKTLTCDTRCKGYAFLFLSTDLHLPMFLLSPHAWVSLPCLQTVTKTSDLQQQATQNHLPNRPVSVKLQHWQCIYPKQALPKQDNI